MSKFYNLGLIGFPLGHSLSPILHSAALQSTALKGRYEVYPIAPHKGGSELQHILAKVRTGEFQGLNVTIPHKQAVIPFLDQLSTVAMKVGAVNTIYRKDDKLVGDNTDVNGFLVDLKRYYLREPTTALILGAGGSAHAIAAALLIGGWKVLISARRSEQANALLAHINKVNPDGIERSASISYCREDLAQALPICSLVVNSTPAGMYPNVTGTPWFDGLPMPPDVLVYDLVYNPAETAFVRFCRMCGANGVTGLGMLIEQAALSFQIWTGAVPDCDRLYDAASQRFIQE